MLGLKPTDSRKILHGSAMVSHEIDTDTMQGMRSADMVSVFLSVASGKVRRGDADSDCDAPASTSTHRP